MTSTVHVVLPGDVDDPATPSGGNYYDRRLCDGLRAHRPVREHPVRGAWPQPAPADRGRLADVLAALPDQATAVVDGLIASAVPDLLQPHSVRLRLITLMHMPLGTPAEGQALRACAAVVTTSEWARTLLSRLYADSSDRIHVAAPGADAAPIATGTAAGSRLLTVAAVTPIKGHDILVDALATLADRQWTLDCAGSLDRDPAYARSLQDRVRAAGLADRIRWHGARTREEIARGYGDADLLVHPTRTETFGMVVTEALARGIPVVASDVGGVPEALGATSDGGVPGLLVPPDDPAALAAALRAWLDDEGLRARLRQAAVSRRPELPGWDVTAARFAEILTLAEASRAHR
ncbi:MAG: glycosyltransferase family 4 protein [Hamadaea sp.]|nr:glycosyltransferase family 4 protein [Hamadaea sp.]